MRSAFALVSVLVLCSSGCWNGRAPVQPAEPTPASFDGTYQMEKSTAGTTWLHAGARQDFEVVIAGDTMRFTGKSWRGDPTATFKTDTSKTPATIDRTDTIGGEVIPSYGIYKLEGDVLTMALATEGGAASRPTDFTPREKVTIEVFRRK